MPGVCNFQLVAPFSGDCQAPFCTWGDDWLSDDRKSTLQKTQMWLGTMAISLKLLDERLMPSQHLVSSLNPQSNPFASTPLISSVSSNKGAISVSHGMLARILWRPNQKFVRVMEWTIQEAEQSLKRVELSRRSVIWNRISSGTLRNGSALTFADSEIAVSGKM